MYLIIHTKSGKRHVVPLPDATITDPVKLCEEFYEPLDFSTMNTFRLGSLIVYCREIEAIEFSAESDA